MIGTLSLNLSFILYLITYLPQLIHNQKSKQLGELSPLMHSMLYFAYLLDLYYSFSLHYQWQYKVVASVGVILLTIQHIQLIIYHKKNQHRLFFYLTSVSLFTVFIFGYVLPPTRIFLSDTQAEILGFLSRACFLGYTLPQIIKNHRIKQADAISLLFIYFSLILACLDLISAWSLHWGWANRLGGFFSIPCLLILWEQHKRYSSLDSSRSHERQ